MTIVLLPRQATETHHGTNGADIWIIVIRRSSEI